MLDVRGRIVPVEVKPFFEMLRKHKFPWEEPAQWEYRLGWHAAGPAESVSVALRHHMTYVNVGETYHRVIVPKNDPELDIEFNATVAEEVEECCWLGEEECDDTPVREVALGGDVRLVY